MKKYLNRNVFFQGDSKIVIILISLFMALWALLEICVKNQYYTDYGRVLYDYTNYSNYTDYLNYGYANSPLGSVVIIILIIFLLISFILICGMFKRKKWSTLLSCTFSRMDIRKRELTLMCGCIIGFILIFLIVCIRYSIENDILVSYISGFWGLVGMDVIRIIVTSLVVTSILFCLDSLTSNMYVTLGTIFTMGIYCGAIIITIANCFVWSYSDIRASIVLFVKDMLESIIVGSKENIYSYKFLIAVIVLILITIICGIITKKLTKKIKVEHMGDAFIFRQIRNVMPFLISTLIGMGVGNIIFQNLLWNGNFELSLNVVSYPIVGFSIIIIVSLITNIIIKSAMRAFKNKIPKKYI